MNIMDYFSSNISSGKIVDIIDNACKYYRCSSARDLNSNQKLNALCTALQVSSEDLDFIIANNSEVNRTVNGHAFEIVFDKMMVRNGIQYIDVGGDGDVDGIINGITLQLKTPFRNGCSQDVVSYKTHKTHGAKSEREAISYYHNVDEFADFLVGLVSYRPFQVLILPKHDLSRVPANHDYILSPLFIDISNSSIINDFTQIGITKKLTFPQDLITLTDNELLPLSSNQMQIKSEYILDAIFKPENFRIWDMNIRGFTRERILHNIFSEHNISMYSPTITGLERSDKSDIILQNRYSEFVRFQVKGLTYSGCRFDINNSRIDCETQLSRGRVNDHPTQSRLYKVTDFDYLLIVVDPPYSNLLSTVTHNWFDYNWRIYCVPVSHLRTHSTFCNRIASHQYINFLDLEQYLIDDDWLNQWL